LTIEIRLVAVEAEDPTNFLAVIENRIRANGAGHKPLATDAILETQFEFHRVPAQGPVLNATDAVHIA
jgi:hypothetical protein